MAKKARSNRILVKQAPRPKYEITIQNISKQLIPIHARPVGGDFYLSEQQFRLRPNDKVTLQKDALISVQIRNLQSRRLIRVLHDTELAAEQLAAKDAL